MDEVIIQEPSEDVEELEFEEASLSDALDSAFDNLMGENLVNITVEAQDAKDDVEFLKEETQAIINKESQILEDAKKLDIDLSFWD